MLKYGLSPQFKDTFFVQFQRSKNMRPTVSNGNVLERFLAEVFVLQGSAGALVARWNFRHEWPL